MRRITSLAAVGVLFLSLASGRAEEPKFDPLDVKGLKAVAAVDLKGGIVFSAGAFDLGATPTCMILADLKFPKGVKFISEKMTYLGMYTDPGTNIKGYLYHLKTPDFERYFLVQESGINGPTDSQRYIVNYDATGKPLTYFRGTFAEKP